MTRELLMKYLECYPEKGIFIWKPRDISEFNAKKFFKTWHTKNCGKVAGSKDRGYLVITLLGKLYRQHRLMWLYVYGEFPKEIDHIDGNGHNNKISNLRNVNRSINMRNKKKHKNNTSGHCGVSLHKLTGKWRVREPTNERTASGNKRYKHHYFSTKEEAIEFRSDMKKRLGFTERHGKDLL